MSINLDEERKKLESVESRAQLSKELENMTNLTSVGEIIVKHDAKKGF